MLVRKAPELTYRDITPKSVYLDRRKFLQGMGLAGVAAAGGRGLLNWLSPSITAQAAPKLTGLGKSQFSTDQKQTPYNDVTHYNKFYDIDRDTRRPAHNSQN